MADVTEVSLSAAGSSAQLTGLDAANVRFGSTPRMENVSSHAVCDIPPITTLKFNPAPTPEVIGGTEIGFTSRLSDYVKTSNVGLLTLHRR